MKHVCQVTITLDTSVNGGPPTKPMTELTLHNGDHITINQPVEVYFSADGPPTPLLNLQQAKMKKPS